MLDIFGWMVILVAGGFLLAFLAIGAVLMVLALLTVGIPAAFLSGHPVIGLLLMVPWLLCAAAAKQ